MLVSRTFLDDEVDEVGGCSRSDWAFDTENFTSDDFDFHVVVLVDWNLFILEFLVGRWAELVFGIEVQPQLKANRRCVETSRHLCVYDAFASCHPLDVTGAKCASIVFEVFMANLTR